jgi:cytochrome c2
MQHKVYRRFLIGLVLLLGALFLGIPATLASGWAVITLDQLPTEVVAGKPIQLGFMIRQHGRTAWLYDQVMVQAVQTQSHERISVQAKAEGARGHYTATLNFPQAGTWRWGIESGLMPGQQPMPDLTVLASSQAGSREVGTSSGVQPLVDNGITGGSFPLSLGIGLIGSIATVGTLFFWWRKRTPLALLALTAAAVIGVIGFSLVARASAFSQDRMTKLPDQTASAASTDLGQALFVAKGCIVCHQYAAVRDVRQRFGNEFVEFRVGPDLPTLATDPKLLHDWLKDPSAMKPNTDMPNLELKEAEIEALVAFLLTPKGTAKEVNAPDQ